MTNKLIFKLFRTKSIFRLLILLSSQSIPGFAQQSNILIDDNFANHSESWKEIKLNGATHGEFTFVNNSLAVSNLSKFGGYGLYNLKPVSGNFYAEAEFAEEDVIGLALIASVNGVPDVKNFTMIAVSNRSGVTFINQYDRQNNIENVHDPKKVVDPSRYEAKLDGTTFSVPYKSTNRKIRIFHESLSNTFHFYYGTSLDKWGITSNDWMEVAPQYSWLPADQQFFVALVGRVAEDQNPKAAVFKRVKLVQTPTDDFDDSTTGFKAVKRNFSWSGFEGVATVVSFGKEFGYDKNIKFVFWDRANYTPAWRLTNQFLLNFEFFEGGDSLYPGCHEAMSDRQRHGQTVTIIEDNAVRKIIRWHGIPLNPDYNFTGENLNGELFPYYQEFWTFYPDGTGTRQFIDMPNLDVEHRRSWGPEIIEPMPIGGSLVEAGDLCNAPALSVFNMTDSVKIYFPQPTNRTYSKDSWGWDQVVFDCHFKDNMPDFYTVYSQDEKYPEIWPGIKIETQISWHNTDHIFSHWPVGREPYGQNTNDWGRTSRSYASHLNEVTHTSLASAGFYGKLGVDFNNHYLIDQNGRKFRRHVMLIGVSKPYEYDEVKNQIQTWLEPGEITMLTDDFEFVKIDRLFRSIILKSIGNQSECKFQIKPNNTIVNPTITIENWQADEDTEVLINGSKVASKTAKEGNSLLVWIEASFNQLSEITILTVK